MAASVSVRVRGLPQLQRAFKGIEKDIVQDFVWELEEAADPVRQEATTLIDEMSNVRDPYDRQKVGVSRGANTVYIQPDWRRGGGSPRPQFGSQLERRMQKAVDRNKIRITKKISDMCDDIADNHGF